MIKRKILKRLIDLLQEKVSTFSGKIFEQEIESEVKVAYVLATFQYILDIAKTILKKPNSLSTEILVRSMLEAMTIGILLIEEPSFLSNFDHNLLTNELEKYQYLDKNIERFKEEGVESGQFTEVIGRLQNKIKNNVAKGIVGIGPYKSLFEKVSNILNTPVYASYYTEIYGLISNTSAHLLPSSLLSKYLVSGEFDQTNIKFVKKRVNFIPNIIDTAIFILLIYSFATAELIEGFDSQDIISIQEEFSAIFV